MDNLENSSQRWDRIWTNGLITFYPHLPFSRVIENFVRWHLHFRAIDKLLDKISLEGKDILELGSGTGSNSIYLAKYHKAKTVTLLDFSERALARARTRFCPCPAIKIQEDILEFSPKQSYDFVHSTGLVEHFTDKERLLVVKKHAQCTRPGGLIMIWVPIASLTFKPIEKINRCLGIKEIPFTKNELRTLCKESNLEIVRDGETVFGALYGILARKTK